MAFLAPLSAVGGGAFGNIGLSLLGLGINLALAFFFPQKIKGPRQEELRAQTSKYGDQIARSYGSAKIGGAVIWLKNDKVDEHKDTDRKGSIGPVVTEFTYTADFAIAFTWNGPVAGISRMWADDKIIYDHSAETLDKLINGDSDAFIGDAEGATFTIYKGLSTQIPNADIEADRGVGLVPGLPGLVYVVVKNFPLDEFGIRVPNIEAEVVRAGNDVTLSETPGAYNSVSAAEPQLVSFTTTNFRIQTVPGFDTIIDQTWPGGEAVGAGGLVTQRGDIAVKNTGNSSSVDPVVWFFDSGNGGLNQTLTLTIPGDGIAPGSYGGILEISTGGIDRLFVWTGENLCRGLRHGPMKCQGSPLPAIRQYIPLGPTISTSSKRPANLAERRRSMSSHGP
jgi:hypothetical protein